MKSEKEKFFFPSGHVTYQIYPLMCLNAINPSYFVKKKQHFVTEYWKCIFATRMRICYEYVFLNKSWKKSWIELYENGGSSSLKAQNVWKNILLKGKKGVL